VAAGAALASLLRVHRRLRLDIQSKRGRQRVVVETLFVGNNRLQLLRLGISKAQSLDQHRLVAVTVRPVSALGMLALVLRALIGKLESGEDVSSFDFEGMTVRPWFGGRPARIKVATDGEVEMMSTPLTFGVLPDALWLLRPAEAGEDPG
jgi:diacylglycerol kinase family enzyme